MRTFCTIITANYLPYALTLYKSLQALHAAETLHVLVFGECKKHDDGAYPGIRILSIENVYGTYQADVLYHKYAQQDMDALRWSMKPVLLLYLLQQGYSKAIYADCDIFFVSEYNGLFDQLDAHDILLTPQRTTRDPQLREEEFLTTYKYGLYNAGFIAASAKAVDALKWWADCCAYKVETNFAEGLFVDQKYLDAMPVYFPRTGIVRHQGANIAGWNQLECKRSLKDGQVFINDIDPLLFVHFSNKYIPELMAGSDAAMQPVFARFVDTFKQTGHSLHEFIRDLPEEHTPNALTHVKRKLLLRTRLRRWLYKLSKSI